MPDVLVVDRQGVGGVIYRARLKLKEKTHCKQTLLPKVSLIQPFWNNDGSDFSDPYQCTM